MSSAAARRIVSVSKAARVAVSALESSGSAVQATIAFGLPSRVSSRVSSASFSTLQSIRSRSYATYVPSTSENVGDDVRKGVEGFLSQQTFKTMEDWQAGLWQRLEQEIQTQPALAKWHSENSQNGINLVNLLTYTAREPQLTLAFNYASLILNNSYFLEKLSPNVTSPPQQVAHLEQELVGKARGMTGSGWLWLVEFRDSGRAGAEYGFIPTYGPGTVLVRNKMFQGRQDYEPLFRPETTPNTLEDTASSSTGRPQPSRAIRPDANARDSLDVTPRAVINLFEHAYLNDYGVWGKEQYVRDWFRHVNWNKALQK